MIKKFTLLLLFAFVAVNSFATERVVFLGEYSIGSWNTTCNIDKAAFSSLNEGDMIIICYEADVDGASAAKETYYQLQLKSSSVDLTEVVGLESSGEKNYYFTPTGGNVTQIKSNGLQIAGHFAKIKSVSYVERTSLVLDASKLPFDTGGNWDNYLPLSLPTLQTAVVGDEIYFDIKSTDPGTRGYCQGAVQGTDLGIGSSDLNGKTYAIYTLTSDNVEKISSSTYLQFGGEGVEVNNIYLIQHNKTYVLSPSATIDLTKVPNSDVSVEFCRNFNNWNTLCLPFEWTIPDDFTNVYTYDSYDDGTIYFNKVTSETVSAGTPCLIEASDTQITLSAIANIYNASPSTSENFKGNYIPGASMDGKYGVAWSNKDSQWAFIKGSSSSTAKAFSAYFDPSAYLQFPSPSLSIVIGGTTNIEKVQNVEKENGEIYNLMGTKMTTVRKGIYIKNGKKYIVK